MADNNTKVEAKETETMVASVHKQEVKELLTFLDELAPNESERFFAFIQGIRFSKNIAQNSTAQ